MLNHPAFPLVTHVSVADIHVTPVFLSISLLLGCAVKSHCSFSLGFFQTINGIKYSYLEPTRTI